MDHGRALAQLAPTYVRALVLRAQGSDDAAIAAALGVEVEAVGPLLALAALKLERLIADTPDRPLRALGTERGGSRRRTRPE